MPRTIPGQFAAPIFQISVYLPSDSTPTPFIRPPSGVKVLEINLFLRILQRTRISLQLPVAYLAVDTWYID